MGIREKEYIAGEKQSGTTLQELGGSKGIIVMLYYFFFKPIRKTVITQALYTGTASRATALLSQ